MTVLAQGASSERPDPKDGALYHVNPANDTKQGIVFGPDSIMVRAFASEAGCAGSNPGRIIPKMLKMVPVATLLGAQH